MPPKIQIGYTEKVALVSCSVAMGAFSIDVILPGISLLAQSFGTSAVEQQKTILFLLIGAGFAPIFYGFYSDVYGRRPLIILGLVVFIAGTLLCFLATEYQLFLLGRFLQGVGLSGPRVVVNAFVRDQYSGDRLAKFLSLVQAVFIFVPIVAPMFGQLVLDIAHWRFIFVLLFSFGLFTLVWFFFRFPETLVDEKRVSGELKSLLSSLKSMFANRVAMLYAMSAAVLDIPFFFYLSVCQQLYSDAFNITGHYFSFYFAVSAFAIGLAGYVNSRLVEFYGMRRMMFFCLVSLIIVSWLFFAMNLIVVEVTASIFILYLFVIFFWFSLVSVNLNSLALDPMGHIAGLASSVFFSIRMLIPSLVVLFIGGFYDGSVMPLVITFSVCSSLVLGLVLRKTRM